MTSERSGHRILFNAVSYFPETRGGSAHQAQLQAEELARRGHCVTVVCPSRRPGVGTINGVRVHRLPGWRLGAVGLITYGFCLGAYLLLQTRRFEIVHAHSSFFLLLLTAFGALYGRPVYLKLTASGPLRGDVARIRQRGRFIRSFCVRHLAKIQALSGETLCELSSLGVPRDRIAVIPNGYRPTTFHPVDGSNRDFKRALGLPTDKIVILYTGRFSFEKGLPDLLAAWRSLPGYDAVLVLVGSYETFAPMPCIPPEAWLYTRGWTECLVDYLRAADIFVLPSYAEGMSNSLLEAMASGLPVVASRVGAVEAMIEEGKTGLIVSPGDRAALASALRRLIEDADLRQVLGGQAAAVTPERYSIAAVVDAIEEAYAELIG